MLVISRLFVSSTGYLAIVEILLCLVALWVVTVKRQWDDFWSLGSFLAVRAISDITLAVLLCVYGRQLNGHTAYKLYFNVYWASFAVEYILQLIIVYSIFRLAMAPLKGLQSLGMLIFRWAAAISIAVALGSAFAPHVSKATYTIAAVSQLQRTESILTLCLLLFVCFAIRPMGLDYSSRIFGVGLGLGLMATTDLVQASWIALSPKMHTAFNLVNGIVICVTLVIWVSYFALPEPKRRIIVLPTTSPFLRWNQISQALGDSPGFVAVGGIPPEIFAPAEIEIMRRASLKMVTPFPRSKRAS